MILNLFNEILKFKVFLILSGIMISLLVILYFLSTKNAKIRKVGEFKRILSGTILFLLLAFSLGANYLEFFKIRRHSFYLGK